MLFRSSDPLLDFLSGAAAAPAAPPEPPDLDEDALSAEVESVLDWMAASRYQSDERFIESRVHARAGRFGQSRIRQELARHGVELDPDTRQSLKDSELARAREVWRKRFGEPAADAAGRAKQMRFLAGRGFAPEVIRRVLGGRDDD